MPLMAALLTAALWLPTFFFANTPPMLTHCCECVIGFHPETGQPVWTCSCFVAHGGKECDIDEFGCTARGFCTS